MSQRDGRRGTVKAVLAGQGLLSKVANAGAWAFAVRVLSRLLGTVRTIVLARLLAPDDWGLYGVTVLAMLLVDEFSETGLRAALVHKKGDIKEYLYTAWTLQVIRSVVVSSLLFFGAPVAADLLGAAAAEPFIRLISLALLIDGFSNIATIPLEKEFVFRRLAKLDFLQSFIEASVAISVALLVPNAWAPVAGLVAGKVARVIASYVMIPFLPRFRLDLVRAKELTSYGVWIFATAIVSYLYTNVDDIVVSRVLGVASLGLYRMAFNLSHAVVTELQQIVNQVTFPAYSSLQDDPIRIRRGFVRHLSAIALVGTPLAFGTIAIAHPFTSVVLGETWIPMVGAMQLLAITGLARSFGGITVPLFNGLGRPSYHARFRILKFVILAAVIYPLVVNFGLVGAAWATILAGVSVDAGALVWTTRVLGGDLRDIAKAMGYPLGAGVVMIGAVWAAEAAMSGAQSWLALVALIATGALAYFGALWAMSKVFGYRPLSYLSSYAVESRRT
jgi:O-antigen/teichoic acid export membrane protein